LSHRIFFKKKTTKERRTPRRHSLDTAAMKSFYIASSSVLLATLCLTSAEALFVSGADSIHAPPPSSRKVYSLKVERIEDKDHVKAQLAALRLSGQRDAFDDASFFFGQGSDLADGHRIPLYLSCCFFLYFHAWPS